MTYLKEPIILFAIGGKLRNLRKQKKLSQEALAHKAGIAVSQVGRLERGKLNPSISTLFVISMALEIEPKDLFDFEIPFLENQKRVK